MRIQILPKTRLGKWSAGFGAGFAAYFLFISPILMALNQRKVGEEVVLIQAFRPILIALGLLIMVSGILAFITGLISFFKYKERSVIIYVSVVIGFFAVVFLLGEFLLPH